MIIFFIRPVYPQTIMWANGVATPSLYKGMGLKVFPIFAKNIFIVRLYTRKGGLLYPSIQFSIQFTFLVVFRMYRIISLD